jgi:hypothetical protein
LMFPIKNSLVEKQAQLKKIVEADPMNN